jgi:hypothetical protein
MSDNVHYNIEIKVTKVEFMEVKDKNHPGRMAAAEVTQMKRVISDAGHVNIKSTDFAEAKRLAGAHLDLLTKFTGSDPREGNLR